MSELKIKIKSLDELLDETNLEIPPYQRPYSWTEKQLTPLLNDLYKKEDNLLIMGGVILHNVDNSYKKFNIVDGQQRLISFSIIKYLINKDDNSYLLKHKFKHKESIANISNNTRLIQDLKERKGYYPSLKNIKFIVIITPYLDDAFSFFDSQNTRGKKLEVYDILKAHHLRFIKSNDLATLCAKDWEKTEKDTTVGMTLLLETLLARGRRWTHNNHQPPDLRVEFKSQREKKEDANTYILNRYQQVALFDTWKYNPAEKEELELNFKKIDASYKVGSIIINDDISHFFPFQITQTIEGGELFFWFTQKYYMLTKELFLKENPNTSDEFERLVFKLKTFRWNTGASYVYDLYIGALLFYFDKFGYEKLDEVSISLFYSIYWLRFKLYSVQYASIYKYVREDFNPFLIIAEASFPEFIINKCERFLEGKYKKNQIEFRGFREHLRNSICVWESKSEFELISKHNFYKQLEKK